VLGHFLVRRNNLKVISRAVNVCALLKTRQQEDALTET
jgi:hypothetical protein